MTVLVTDVPRPTRPKRNDKAVKIERELAVKAALIAEQLGYASMAEYLSELLRGPIERDWPKAIKALEQKGTSRAAKPKDGGAG